MRDLFAGFFFIDAKSDIDFRYNYVSISIEREMTLVGRSACDGKRRCGAEPFIVVPEQHRGHMRGLS
ncbi:hypothetical protein VZT92_021766 [Zoarces viviparus]|uniref:Uncharacterized protein n=1 Tax=Zoarces viviparus TaxID=48416 RepID=A0AAW1EBH8_ZOAVI